jgi:small GTP-binding protein
MKVVLLGNSEVGKTCILTRLVSGVFSESAPTIGAAFQTHMVTTPSGTVTLQIWDTAGQEQYRSLSPMYYRSAQVALLCYDITNIPSFEAISGWVEELTAKAGKAIRILIVATKADLAHERMVPARDAREFAAAKGAAAYLECSARTGEGIAEIFTKAAQLTAASASGTKGSFREESAPELAPSESKCC